MDASFPPSIVLTINNALVIVRSWNIFYMMNDPRLASCCLFQSMDGMDELVS